MQSQLVTMLITVEQDRVLSGGRKKRAAGDLADYVPGQLDAKGTTMIADKVSLM